MFIRNFKRIELEGPVIPLHTPNYIKHSFIIRMLDSFSSVKIIHLLHFAVGKITLRGIYLLTHTKYIGYWTLLVLLFEFPC